MLPWIIVIAAVVVTLAGVILWAINRIARNSPPTRIVNDIVEDENLDTILAQVDKLFPPTPAETYLNALHTTSPEEKAAMRERIRRQQEAKARNFGRINYNKR